MNWSGMKMLWLRLTTSLAVAATALVQGCWRGETIEWKTRSVVNRGVIGVRISGFVWDHRSPPDNLTIQEAINGKKVFGISKYAFDDCPSVNTLTISGDMREICADMFKGLTMLKTVIIEEGVEKIGTSAFAGCTSLSFVKAPKSLKTIGDGAFEGCALLRSVTIPEGVNEIESDAFKRCSSLTFIVVPENVKKIGSGVFTGCTALKSLDIPGALGRVEGRFLITPYKFREGAQELNSYWGQDTHVTIPLGVKGIAYAAFEGCQSLQSVEIPGCVKEVHARAFSNCTALKSVLISSGVEKLEIGAFKGCTALMSITLGEGVEEIEWGAFAKCTSLKSVTLPKSLIKLRDDAFKDCVALTSVTVSEGMKPSVVPYPLDVSRGPFNGCKSLKAITYSKAHRSGTSRGW